MWNEFNIDLQGELIILCTTGFDANMKLMKYLMLAFLVIKPVDREGKAKLIPEAAEEEVIKTGASSTNVDKKERVKGDTNIPGWLKTVLSKNNLQI